MYAKSLKPFYEPITIRPLIHGHIVEAIKEDPKKNLTYRVERWFSGDEGKLKIGCPRRIFYTKEDYIELPQDVHCYVFIDITMDSKHIHKKPFAKKPSYVDGLIKENKLIITNCPYTIWKK